MVGRRTAGPDLHQHPPCLAHQLARRLLAARPAGGPPQEAWRQRAGSQPAVRAVQSRRDKGRLRAAERSLRRGPGERSDLAPDAGRFRSGEQRRGRLGERGRARSARLFPLEPGRHAYRLLAVRPARRGQLPAHLLPGQGARHRHAVAVSAAGPLPGHHERAVSARRHDELRSARRRRRDEGRRRPVDGAAGRAAGTLRRPAAVGGRAHAARPAAEPPAEHGSLPARGGHERIGARDVARPRRRVHHDRLRRAAGGTRARRRQELPRDQREGRLDARLPRLA